MSFERLFGPKTRKHATRKKTRQIATLAGFRVATFRPATRKLTTFYVSRVFIVLNHTLFDRAKLNVEIHSAYRPVENWIWNSDFHVQIKSGADNSVATKN